MDSAPSGHAHSRVTELYEHPLRDHLADEGRNVVQFSSDGAFEPAMAPIAKVRRELPKSRARDSAHRLGGFPENSGDPHSAAAASSATRRAGDSSQIATGVARRYSSRC